MKSKILSYVDFDRANTLLEGFNKVTGFVTAILDLEGNILSKSGWREICTDFHRVHPEMASNCMISDTELSKIGENDQYHYYKCLNGLVDVSMPIVVRGEHIANLFSGQFFMEEPDYTFFKMQAHKFGLDESAYLEALAKVPVVSKDKVEITISFLVDIAKMIIEMTAEKLDQIELNDEIKKSEKKYKELYYENQNKRALIKTLMDSVSDLIFHKDVAGVYVGCNVAFEKLAGRSESEIIGFTDRDFFPEEQAELYITMDQEVIRQGTQKKNDEVAIYPDGNRVYLETLKTPYFDDSGNLLGLIGISRDITERKKKEEEIIYLTYHDSLTGLYNRTYYVEKTIDLDVQDQLPLSVIMGDINGLKLINDAFGHREGDKLLNEVAKILLSCVRKEDIVARIGGDEFCILLPRTDYQVAQSIVDGIKNVCEQYANQMDKEMIYISISLGYATKYELQESFDKVLKSAEELMYRKKLLEYNSLRSSIMSSIRTTMYEKSHETEEHTERLADLSKKLGKIMGLSDQEMVELELLSMLHDIGKIGIEDSILTKCAGLTDDEWHEMKKHPEIGYRIAMAAPELKHIAEYILCHHERWDGRGYPQGLSNEKIPILSRIISIVDSYDAMTNDRVYRKAISKEKAKSEILENAGTQFDPKVARLFVNEVLRE